MVFKKSLAASGYVASLFGGGYVAYDYFQDSTIGDLLNRLGTVHSTEEEYQKAYTSLKDDSQFIQDINNGSSLSGISNLQGGLLLKKWCDLKSTLSLSDENIKQVLRTAQKYCTAPEKDRIAKQINNGGLSLKNIKKEISSRGIDNKGQLFVTFVDNSNPALGRKKYYSYCWDIAKKDWVSSTDEKDCRKKNGIS